MEKIAGAEFYMMGRRWIIIEVNLVTPVGNTGMIIGGITVENDCPRTGRILVIGVCVNVE